MAAVKLLLQFGAVTVEKVGWGGSVHVIVDIAIESGYTEVVDLFEPVVQNPNL